MTLFAYVTAFICSIIMLLQLLTLKKLKKRVFNRISLKITKKMKKALESDIELLFKQIRNLSPTMFRSLKLMILLESEDTLTSKVVNTMFTTLTTIISIIAMMITLLSTVDSSLLKPYITTLMDSSVAVTAIILFIFATFHQHLNSEDEKRKFIQRFLVVINEIEKEQPITVRLSEDQYQALSTSSNLQRTVYRFGRTKNH